MFTVKHYSTVIGIICDYLVYRWCLFPTECPKDILKPLTSEAGCNRNEAIAWFQFIYPRTQLDTWPKQLKPVGWQQK